MERLLKLLIAVETLDIEELKKLNAWVEHLINNRSKENEYE